MGKTVVFVLLFLVIGGVLIVATNQYQLDRKQDRIGFFWDFARWVVHLGSNIKDITALVIRQTWLPQVGREEQQKNMTIKTFVVKRGA
ncbi:MAG: hypothetical protein GXP63_00095 [DPANN group archaeon]|nr:hypothetical protein [DPANN group archaeon]